MPSVLCDMQFPRPKLESLPTRLGLFSPPLVVSSPPLPGFAPLPPGAATQRDVARPLHRPPHGLAASHTRRLGRKEGILVRGWKYV